MNPFKKLSYKKNYYSKDIVKPLVFLCNKNLTRIGRLNPVNDLNISVNYNAADEISLSLPKYVQENKVFLYDKIEDLSVIEVKNGFDDESRYFEVGMDEKDTGAILKSITGKELGYAELSQKLVTLEINTDVDIALDDYVPTVLYNSDNKKGSLLDRLLSYAPDYEVGHVDDTVAGLQRTFSWSDSYMDACLNDICEELECIYTITVGLDENDKVIKRINIYDICYCKDCWDNMVNNKSTDMTKGDYWKNVLNGVCQTCKGTNVYDVGVDTPILLNTKNFSDDISVQVDKDSIKNCFKLKAGDDTLTNIVEGVLATSTNKIMMFSEDQTSKMSDELRAEWEAYCNKVNNSNTTKEYDNLTNLKYDIFDLVGFIKSSKMPTVETDQGGLDAVYNTLIKGLESYDYKFYTPSSLKFSKASSGSNAVKSLVAIYIGNGYSFSVDGDSTFNSSSPDLDNDSYYVWKGTVKVYKTDDRDTYFVLSAKENGIVVEFHYGKEGQVSTKATTGKFFKIYYGNKDLLSYKSYLDQQIKYTLHDNDVTEYDERDWSKYSIERLKSFYDGYEECLTMLDKMELTIEEEVGKVTADLLSGQKSIIDKLRKNYTAYVEDITNIKFLLEDQVFSLYYCLDSEQLAEQYPPLNNSQDYHYKLQICSSIREALDSLINGYLIALNVYNDDGSVGVGNNPQYVGSLSSPNHGVQCLNCGSTNLQYDRDYGRYYCTNKGCTAGYKKVVTYFDYAKAIYKWFDENYGKGDYFSDIEDNIRKIQTDLYIRNNFTDENYKELCSFIREDVYENSNYTSDNIVDNTRLLETARKFVDRAKQQLAIACIPQISITATASSLLVQSDIPNEELFDDFAIGNYIRVSIDDTVYKLRIIGIKYDFENLEKVEVTFSNVTKSLFGAMSDIQNIFQQASSMATSFSSVAKQAENGQTAARKFEYIKKEGLDSSLGAIKAAKNQEIVVDDHGILCRYYNKWLNQYDDRQLKIINQNIVMTDDAWENAKLAIGLGQYNGEAKWGVWADMLVGDLIITKDLKVINDGNTVELNKDGLVLDGGAIKWKNNKLGTDAINGLDDSLSDLGDKITKGDKANSDALASYQKEIKKFQDAVNGSLGVTTITSDSAIFPKIGGGYLYISKDKCSVEIDPEQKNVPNNSNVIKVTANGSDVFYITRNGDGYFKGEIQATSGSFKGKVTADSGKIGSWNIDNGWLRLNEEYTVLSDGNISSAGINWSIRNKNNTSEYYDTNMNGANTEMTCKGAVKFRFNSYGDAVNSISSNCLYTDVGYIKLKSSGNVNLNGSDVNLSASGAASLSATGNVNLSASGAASSIEMNAKEVHVNTNIVLTNPGTNSLYGYNWNKTSIFKITGITYLSDGRHTTDFGNNLIGTNIYGNQVSIIGQTPTGKGDIHIDGASIYMTTISGGVYSNGSLIATSDKRVKKDISSFDKRYENFFMSLSPSIYKFINGTSDRYHSGFISQETEEALVSNGLTTKDFAGFIIYNDPETNEEKYALRYEEFIALNTHMIQKLYKRIEELEKKLESK